MYKHVTNSWLMLLAVVGIVVKTVFFSSVPEWLGVGAYLALGWGGAFSMLLVVRRWGLRAVSPLALGGIAYTAGALCELTNSPVLVPGVVGSHEVFHLAVLVGLGSMWLFMHRIARVPEESVVAFRARRRRAAPEPAPPRAGVPVSG